MLGLATGWGWGLTWGRGGHVRPSGRAWLDNPLYHSCMSRCKLCLLFFFFFILNLVVKSAVRVGPEGEPAACDEFFLCVSQPCKCSNCVCGCEAWFLFFLCPQNGVSGSGKVNEAANERKHQMLILLYIDTEVHEV